MTQLIESSITEEAIDDLYKVNNIFLEEDRAFLIRELQKPEDHQLTINDLRAFFENFQFARFNDRMLVLKELKLEREVAP